jgi:4-carboxymuconolactone decarboxylase
MRSLTYISILRKKFEYTGGNMKPQISFYILILVLGTGMGAISPGKLSAQDMKMYPGKSDVYYSSGNRLPPVDREVLDQFGKDLYDTITDGGRSFTYDEENQEYMGPRAIRMYSPIVAYHNSSANQYLRYESGIDPKLRELTIMNAAVHMNSDYEWTAHEETALEVGVPQDQIDIIKFNKPIPDSLGEEETVIITLCREIFRGDHRVSSETFARAEALFGAKRLVEIVALLGGYTATAMVLNTFDQQLPPGKDSLLPDR